LQDYFKYFAEFGVLGIMGYIFLKLAVKMFESIIKQFEFLIKSLMEQKSQPTTELKEGINTIIQAIANHNSHNNEVFNDLTDKLNQELNQKKDIFKLFVELESSLDQHNIEYIQIINSFKMLLLEMRNNCECTLTKEKLGQRLIEKGYITSQQLNEIIEELKTEQLKGIDIILGNNEKK
jgi:spore germination protein YaaH